VPSNIQGGRETDLTLGLNWYPDVGIRFMANWIKVLQLAAPYNALSWRCNPRRRLNSGARASAKHKIRCFKIVLHKSLVARKA
jgi:hypothetical protein